MKIIIEKHADGYVAYPAGIQGVIVGQGDTFDEALHNIQSAIRFHIETFGRESLELEEPAVDAFVAEAVM
jgi:predicted RNase H-like HicB family nuclease